jgi:hypothetical protein
MAFSCFLLLFGRWQQPGGRQPAQHPARKRRGISSGSLTKSEPDGKAKLEDQLRKNVSERNVEQTGPAASPTKTCLFTKVQKIHQAKTRTDSPGFRTLLSEPFPDIGFDRALRAIGFLRPATAPDITLNFCFKLDLLLKES